MEAVVLHRVRFLDYFCPKQGQDFKPSAAPIYPNMGKVPPGTIVSFLTPVSRTFRDFSADINPFVSSIRTRFKLWQLFCLSFFLKHIKRAASHGKRIIVSRIAFRAR